MRHAVIHPQPRMGEADRARTPELIAPTPIAPFTFAEQQALRLGLMEGERPVALGTRTGPVSRAVDWLIRHGLGVRGRRGLANPKLEALRRFAACSRQGGGCADERELVRFLDAGFSRRHASEIASRVENMARFARGEHA